MSAAIKSLKAGKVSGEDDIQADMLKDMNNFGVCWLWQTCVCQVAWKTGEAPKQWYASVLIPIHKKGNKKKCTNYRALSLPGKVYAKCLEKSCHEIVEPQLQNAKWGFCPFRSTINQVSALQQGFKKLWKYAKEVYNAL